MVIELASVADADTFGGAETYGLLIAASTVGLLLGSLVASRFESVRFGAVTVVGFLVATVGQVGAITAGWLPAVLLGYGIAAIPLGIYNVLVSEMIQTGVPNDLLARVSSHRLPASNSIPSVCELVDIRWFDERRSQTLPFNSRKLTNREHRH